MDYVWLVLADKLDEFAGANGVLIMVLHRLLIGYRLQYQLDVMDLLGKVQRGKLGRIRGEKEDPQLLSFARGCPPRQTG